MTAILARFRSSCSPHAGAGDVEVSWLFAITNVGGLSCALLPSDLTVGGVQVMDAPTCSLRVCHVTVSASSCPQILGGLGDGGKQLGSLEGGSALLALGLPSLSQPQFPRL